MRKNYMLCIDNHGYEASIEIKKIYEVLPDKAAEKRNQIRVVDESGEDYLYPADYFGSVRIPVEIKEKLELIIA